MIDLFEYVLYHRHKWNRLEIALKHKHTVLLGYDECGTAFLYGNARDSFETILP